MNKKNKTCSYNEKVYVYNKTVLNNDYLLKSLELSGIMSHKVYLPFDKKESQKKIGIYKNIIFLVDLNLETEIITCTDAKGIKKYIIKSQNPFETTLDKTADARDFFTKQTEDEDEFLEICFYGNERRNKRQHKTFEQEERKTKYSQMIFEKISSIKGNTEYLKKDESNIFNSKKTIEEITDIIPRIKKTNNKMTSKKGILYKKKMPYYRSYKPLITKRKNDTSAFGHFKRNIFTNFTPKPKQRIRKDELSLPHRTWISVKNPCREMRKQVSTQIYRDITGQRCKRPSISINIPKHRISRSTTFSKKDDHKNDVLYEDIHFKTPPNIQSVGRDSFDRLKFHQNIVTDSDLVNTFFIRADSSSDDTSQIF